MAMNCSSSVFKFSMLLLEPGEIYFEDFSCTACENPVLNKDTSQQGRLKLCSKSLVFESRDITDPLIKFHFKDCTEISIEEPSNIEGSNNVIKVKAMQYAEMLAENILAPYNFQYTSKTLYFFFDFANVEDCLALMEQLKRASTLRSPEHNSMIATILHSRYMRMVFDPVMMDDFTERILLELPVEKITPLVRHQGKLALTETTLYFQPFNNIENSSILKLKLKYLRRMYKRRFLLKQVGLEIHSEDDTVPHIYLTFQSTYDRDCLYNHLEQSQYVNLEKVKIEEMTLQWQNGIVSNYDYLMYLNCLADRSKNDLTQYPVFPWVIADYKSDILDFSNTDSFRDLSKPIGALNPERLEKILERYYEMSEPKFMYGSHYSAPGLVLFYLVRKYPQYMLCLQNGRFDHPDRMFNSVADVYNNCCKNMSDFKELVPEFYDTSGEGDFLVNKYDIYFGKRHDDRTVGDVSLPPWAKTPKCFVQKLRDALESEYVSRHLHLWIDLIFGYKQRGQEAVKANNLFHHICYEGSVDLECVPDMHDRHALEVQIMEFGQVPTQLFIKPHVRRIIVQIEKPLQNLDENNTVYKLECLDTVLLHREEVMFAVLDGHKVISVGKDGTLKVYDREQKKQIRSVVLCSTPLSSCVIVGKNIVACGSWDNQIYLYDVEYGKVLGNFRAHEDSVSCLLWIPEERLLVSGGCDCMVSVWDDVLRAGKPVNKLRCQFDHDGRITALTYRRQLHVDVISGTSDGEVYIWSLDSNALLNRMYIHAGSLTTACYIVSGERVITTSDDGDMCITDVNLSHSMFQKHLPTAVSSLCWDRSRVLWLGCCDGSILQWDIHTVSQTNTNKLHDGMINSVCVYNEENSKILVTSSADKSVKLWRCVTS